MANPPSAERVYSGAMKTNLHLHSKFSDGMLWPEEVAARGKTIGLERMALTDHDSMEGIERFLAACGEAGIVGVAGVELDCVAPEIDYDSELLGYFPGGGQDETRALAERRRVTREVVVQAFIENAERHFGVALPFADLRERKLGEEEPAGAPYRLSFNKVDVWLHLLAVGLLPPGTRYSEFKQSPVFNSERPNDKPHVTQIIEAIRHDGGYPVMPHPGHMFGDDLQTMSRQGDELDRRLGYLKDAGLWGIELYFYGNPDRDGLNGLVRAAAARHDLELTCGSDCHGPGSRNDTMERWWMDLDPPW